MAISKSTRPAIKGGRRLSEPFADICVKVWASESHARIEYVGTPERLIAAGCITPDVVQAGRRGSMRYDVHGDRVRRGTRPGGRLWVDLSKPMHRARALPGVAEWLATERKFEQAVELEFAMRQFLVDAPAGATVH